MSNPSDTLMDQCRREAEERYPMPSEDELRLLSMVPGALHESGLRDAVSIEAYAAALYHERSKRPPTVQQTMDAAVECFDLGPEDQDAVLRFGMRLQDMEGPPMITVDEAMAIAWPWIMQTHGGIAPPTGAEADLRARLTAAATNNTNDNEAR